MLIKLQKRCQALEIDITGKEDAKELQELIQAEMESLDVWDGDLFNNKAADESEPEKEEETPSEDEKGEEEEEKTPEDDDPEEKEDGEEEDPEEASAVRPEAEIIEAVDALNDKQLNDVCDVLEVKKDGDLDTKRARILDSTDEAVCETLDDLALWPTEAKEGEDGTDEDGEIDDDKVKAAIAATDYYQRKELCDELGFAKGGKSAAIAKRLIKDGDMSKLAAAITKLELWPSEESPEAAASSEARKHREILDALKEEGIENIEKTINYFRLIKNFESALDIVLLALELWPDNNTLKNLRKQLLSQIKMQEEAMSRYELEQKQLKLEGKKGRKAKEVDDQACRDAVNKAIIAITKREQNLRGHGKGTTRYRAALTQLRRIIKINLR